jgi:CBS domain containing-hemolysin-like protein
VRRRRSAARLDRRGRSRRRRHRRRAHTQPFRAVVTADTNLKAALDGIVSSHTRVAMVVDADDRYLGMLTVDDLAEGIVA